MTPPLRFGVAHDFRCPPGSPYTLRDVYAQTLEQLTIVDALGLDLAWFSEHHFIEDGYLPSFGPVAGATAAATRRIRISTAVLLAPFVHPLRLAEDLAVLDQLSDGRMELGLGLAYAPHEFKAFGIPISRRVSLTEECIDILRLAWRGEPFSYTGRRFQIDGVRVTPPPIQEGGPPLWLAVSSPAGVERAVRYGVDILPQGPRSLLDDWRSASRDAGIDPSTRRTGIIRTFLVTDDPERDWPPLRAAERYRLDIYGGMSDAAGTGGRAKFDQDDRISQRVVVGDVDHCARELTHFITEHGLTDVVTWGSAPGVPPADMTRSMERFAGEVVPKVRAALADSPPRPSSGSAR